MLTPIRFYKSDNIDEINRLLWDDIINIGNKFTFGDPSEIKEATEVFAVFQIWGKALSKLYKGKLPKGWKFGATSNQEYMLMLQDPNKGDQPYTYGQRAHYANQIEKVRDLLKEAIRTGIQSNRICGVIWWPSDSGLKNPPCWQWFQLRTSERNKVSLRLLFRSEDATNGYAANLCGIEKLFVDEVITPAGGILEEIILVATSEHVYDNDLDTVAAIVKPREFPNPLSILQRLVA